MEHDPITALMAKPAFSRRALFSMTAIVGGLHFLGSHTVGNAVIAAYADDNANPTFVVVVLRKDEVGAFVIDAANDNKPVEGALVKLRSWENDLVVTEKTSKTGVAILNVRKLSVNAEDDDAPSYWFFGAGEVIAQGYREYAFLEQYIVSGPSKRSQKAQILLPTQPYDAAKDGAYLRAACFNGADMLYAAADMPKFSTNEASHEVTFQVLCKAGTEAKCALYADGAKIGEGSAKAGESGYATVVFSGTYVKDCLWATEFHAEFEVDGIRKKCPLTLKLREPNIEVEPYTSENWAVSLTTGAGEKKHDAQRGDYYDGGDPNEANDSSDPNASVDKKQFTSTKVDLPYFPWGSLSVLADLPWLPITFTINPNGGLVFSYTSETMSIYSSNKSEPIPHQLKYQNKIMKMLEESVNNWSDSWKGGFDAGIKRFHECQQSAKNRKSCVGAKGYSGLDVTCNFTLGLIAYVIGGVDEKQRAEREKAKKEGKPVPKLNKRWSGTFQACLNFMVSGELGAQITIGVLPVILGVDFYLLATPALEIGVEFNPPFKNPKFLFVNKGVHGEGGCSIDITGEMGLNAAVGVKGIASVGLRGYGRIPLLFGFTMPPEDAYFPHIKVDATVGIQATAQFLFIKVRADVVKPWQWQLYDNWKKEKLDGAEGGYALTAAEFYQDPALGKPLPSDVNYELSYTYDSMLMEASQKTNGNAVEITALLNAEGVICGYDTSNVALPSEEALLNQGFKDPFALDSGDGYDPRKGLKPSIEVPFSAAGSAGEQENQFSDSRVQIVQLGNWLYFCRIATVEVNVNSSRSNALAALGDAGSGDATFSCYAISSDQLVGADAAGALTDGGRWVANAGEDYLFAPKEKDALPQLTYIEGEGDGLSSLQAPTYRKVSLYADQNSADEVVQACIQTPVLSCLGDDDLEGSSDADTYNEFNRAIALAMGYDIDGLDVGSDGLLHDAYEIMVGADSLSGYGTVDNAVPRNRVIVTPFNLINRTWGKTDVIDFNLPSSSISTLRCNMHDVDFTVKAEDGKLLFGIVTTSKPLHVFRTIESMKSTLFTNAACYQPSEDVEKHGAVSNAFSNVFYTIEDSCYEWKAQPLMVNRKGKRDKAVRKYLSLVTTGPVGTYAGKPQHCATCHFYPLGSKLDEIDDSITPASDPNAYVLFPDDKHLLDDDGIIQAFAQKRTGGSDAVVVSWEYRKGAAKGTPMAQADQRSSLWSIDTDAKGKVLGGGPRDYTGAECYTVLGADKGIAWLTRSPNGQNVKMMSAIMGDDGLPKEPRDMGYLNSNGFIASGNSDYLYSVRIMEGSAKKPDAEEAEAVRDCLAEGGAVYSNASGFASPTGDLASLSAEDPELVVKHYQMVACRWDPKYKRYREFFPFAQLSGAPDSFAAYPIPAAGGFKGGTDVVYSTITDLDSQQATLTLAEVPSGLALAFESVDCFDNFIAAGWTVHPTVRVTNVGNMPISAFTVEFKDEDGNIIGTHRVAELHKNVVNPDKPLREEKVRLASGLSDEEFDAQMQAGGFVVVDDAGEYSEEDEAILWPGSTRTYRTEMKTPGSWGAGEHNLHVRIVAELIETPRFDGADSQGFEIDQEYFVLADESWYSTSLTCDGQMEYQDEVEPVYYETVSSGENGKTPKTGDAAGTVVGLAAAAAVAAGAVAAAGAAAVKSSKDE